jgi:hypothetical protein
MKRFKVVETVQATLTKVYYVNAENDQDAVVKYLDTLDASRCEIYGDEIKITINESGSEGFEVEEV